MYDLGLDRLNALRAAFRAGGIPLVGKPDVGPRGCFFARTLDRHGRVERDWEPLRNGITTAGENYLLETGFRGGAAVTTWYASLIAASGFSAVAAADTMASHAGWTELTTYNEAVRQTWSPGAASAGTIVNGTVMTFTNSTGGSISLQGIFITSVSTKGGATGTLWCTALGASAVSIASGGTHQVFYELDLTPLS